MKENDVQLELLRMERKQILKDYVAAVDQLDSNDPDYPGKAGKLRCQRNLFLAENIYNTVEWVCGHNRERKMVSDHLTRMIRQRSKLRETSRVARAIGL